MHKAFIDVGGNGTEAAATAVVMRDASLLSLPSCWTSITFTREM
jgi:serine protease inhibitor